VALGHNLAAAQWAQRNREKTRDYDIQRNGARKGYKAAWYKAQRGPSPFVGVDGEGRDVEEHGHAYFMLRAGSTVRNAGAGRDRLTSMECLEYLSDLPQDRTYVAYFFDYDVGKILADLPWAKLHRLVHRELRVKQHGGLWPVDWEGFEFDWLPGKEFKVRRAGGEWTYINDVGSFFQTTFVKTLELWDIGTKRQREMIAEGKELRADFADVDDAYVDEYNHLECVLLAELMEKFRTVCEQVGYIPRKWQGPGVLAESAMIKHGIPRSADVPILQEAGDDSVVAFGRYAYYGPKFETSTVGYTDAPTVQYDINSAFPAAMLHLPCLQHGGWERVTGKRRLDDDELSICFGRFGWNPGAKRSMFMGFPVRREDGSIHFPLSGKGWYWSFEARAAIHQQFDVYDSWVYTRHCDCKWFDFINGLYADRVSLGKSTIGLVIKLLLNSLYGKLVQSVGNPLYANTIWASFITAWTRTMLSDAIHSLPCCRHEDPKIPCGYDVHMIASDAIYTRDYPDVGIDVGEGIGQWSKDVHTEGLMIVQPGVYFSLGEDDTEQVFKTRGVSKRLVIEHKQEFLDGFERILQTHDVRSGDVLLPARPYIGIRLAVQRRSLKQMGQFIPFFDKETRQPGRRTSFEWSTKRRPQPMASALTEMGAGPRGIRTLPYRGTVGEQPGGRPAQTVPYSKDIGGLERRAIDRMTFEDQPDWVRVQ
jgi:DNA polymerase type B, organellar and viral